jgi:hypothetical protein
MAIPMEEPKKEPQSPAETEERFKKIVRRLVTTPPKHKPTKKAATSKKAERRK